MSQIISKKPHSYQDDASMSLLTTASILKVNHTTLLDRNLDLAADTRAISCMRFDELNIADTARLLSNLGLTPQNIYKALQR
jgi:hypothetical protein